MFNFRQPSGLFSSVAVIVTLLSSAAAAQSLSSGTQPAEFPPASYTANQYVDSRGCVFVRAGISGTTNWVPRVSRAREQLCGFQPTQVSGATRTPPTVNQNVPNPLDTQVAGLPPRTTQAATPTAPVQTAAARPAAVTPAPTAAIARTVPASPATPAAQTSISGVVNPLTGLPVSVAAPAVARPSPQVISAPAPAATPANRVLTRAQACAGLTGVQPRLISQRTGQPVDCGGAAQVQQVASVAPRPAGQPAQARMTRTQACADAAATGRRYLNAATGLPVVCAQTRQIAPQQIATLAPAPRTFTNPLDLAPGTRGPLIGRAAAVPSSNPLDRAPGTTGFTPGANTDFAATCLATNSRLPLRCGPQTQSPWGGGARQVATVSRAQAIRVPRNAFTELLGVAPPEPYSNPTGAYTLPTPPAGFEPVWDDGRLNVRRGLPSGALQSSHNPMAIRTTPQVESPWGGPRQVRRAVAPQPQVAAPQPARTTTRAVAPQPQRAEQISGHRYVQVGTFASRDQAQSIAQSLRSRGLPMRVGVFNRGGQELRLVLAGPFGSDGELQRALGTARGAGYSGAFTRR